MANLNETDDWFDGITQIEEDDPVLGGPAGITNQPPKQLASRTLYQRLRSVTPWSAALAYPLDAYVSYQGSTWKSVAASTNVRPGTDAAKWVRWAFTEAELTAALAASFAGKQPLDATLTALAAIATAADRLFYATGVDQFAVTPLTAFARTLLDDADADAMRTTLSAAPVVSPALGGIPTAPTATKGTNTTQLATTAFVQAAVAALVNSSPAALDTLAELSAALGNDANFAATMTNALANKQPLDTTLTALAAVATTPDKLIYAAGADLFSTTTLTPFARSLLDDADAPTMRTTLGAAPLVMDKSSITRIPYAAAYYNAANVVTGVLDIRLPAGPNSTMVDIEIRGSDYLPGKQLWSTRCGFYYNMGVSPFVNSTAEVSGSAPHGLDVRYVYDGTYGHILLGTTSTVWHYPTLTVSAVLAYTGRSAAEWQDPAKWVFSILSEEPAWTASYSAVVNRPVINDELVGMVGLFARSTPPAGWLKANGAAVSRTAYARLFAAIGTTFGAGDGATTFNVPDGRATFLRGLDDGRGVDSGRVLGSYQDATWLRTMPQEWTGNDSATGSTYAFGNPYASADAVIASAGIPGGAVPSGAKAAGGAPWQAAASDNFVRAQCDVDAGVSNNWIRFRPNNLALLPCIKY